MKKLPALLAVLLFASFSFALTTMHVPAVAANGEGVLTSIEATVTAGNGGVYVDIEPFISVDTQESAKIAAKVAANKAGVSIDNYNVLFKIVADTEIVDGPSGGSALALLAYAEFTGKKPRSDLALTGTIEPDGSIGKIGGVVQKAEAARKMGVKLFLVPSGQSVQGGVDLTQYGERWGMQVVEVSSMDEAIKYAFTAEGAQVYAPKKEEKPLVLRKLEPSKDAGEMRVIAKAEIDDLKKLVRKYENGNSNQTELIHKSLLKSINSSQYLLDQGYYYSAANTAFLARINENAYALANVSKPELKKLVGDLEKQANEMKFANKTLENLDWVVGAQLRYYWALQAIYNLQDRMDVMSPLQLVEDYASAKSWLSAADRMNKIAEQKGGNPIDELKTRDYARRLIEAVNSSLEQNLLDSEALQHADAAILAYTQGDYATSTFDSLFAQALVFSRQKVLKADPKDLKGLVNDSSEKMNSFESAWAQLYYAHSLYNIEEANRTGEFAYFTNAVKLQEISKAFENNVKQLRAELSMSSLPQPSGVPETEPPALEIGRIEVKEAPFWTQPRVLILGGIGVIAIAIIIGILAVRLKIRERAKPLTDEERLRKLDDLLLKGGLSEKTYDRLRSKYAAPEAKLEPRRKRKASR